MIITFFLNFKKCGYAYQSVIPLNNNAYAKLLQVNEIDSNNSFKRSIRGMRAPLSEEC